MSKDKYVVVEALRCMLHGYSALAINDRRITDDNCCGSWTVEHRYKVRIDDLKEAIGKKK